MIVDLSYLNGSKLENFSVERKDGRLPEPVWAKLPAVKDMVVSEQVIKEYSQALTLGIELGQDEVPLLGDTIYDSVLNEAYPELIPGDQFQGGECVFAEIVEGEEIPAGHVYKKTMDALQIKGYAVKFQFSKKARIFNQGGELARTWSTALGRAWRHLRNALRLGPFVTAELGEDNTTDTVYKKVDWSAGTAEGYLLEPTVYATLAAGIKAAKTAKRPASIILCSSADEDVIRDAVTVGYAYGNNRKRPLSQLGIKEVIVYDGASEVVGGETFTYDGVTAGSVYLVRPKRGFFERRKQDLLVDTGEADKSRLIEGEIIADAWLGVYAAVANNTQKCTIPVS